MQFKLPELGEGVHEGELVKWRVAKGESVKYDQPLCEIMTDKATVEIPSAFQGKVADFHAKEGETVHVGQLLISFEGAQSAIVTAPNSPAPTPQAAAPAPAVAASSAVSARASSTVAAPSGAVLAGDVGVATRVLAAPSTRRYARENDINLAQVAPSGPHGRVMREDVEKFLVRGPVTQGSLAREERVPFKGLRKKIAEKMRLSKDKAAHFTYVEEADASELVRLRSQAKEIGAKQGIKVTYLPFILKAMVAALKEFPILNASLDEEKGELVYKHYFNIGLSIQTEDGLTAPVVKTVDQKSVLQLAKEIQDLVDRARAKKLTREDFEGGTITLTNAGSIGGLFATPVINFPEVAILGFNKIFRKPVVKTVGGREEIVIRDWTYFSISLDHRVVDGAVGAEFMNLFIRYIENPSLLLLG